MRRRLVGAANAQRAAPRRIASTSSTVGARAGSLPGRSRPGGCRHGARGAARHTVAFWASAAVFAAGAILCGLLLRPGVGESAPNAEPVLAH